MQKPALPGLTLVGLLVLALSFPAIATSRRSAVATVEFDAGRNAAAVARGQPPAIVVATSNVAPPAELAPQLPSEAKAARVAKIGRDYADLRLALLHQYGREGETFPGGSDALLRQFALLEREKHLDLARAVTAQQLEDMEFHDTAAGMLVQRRLGGSLASEEQRRAVFRLQRDFDLRCGYPADATPASFAEREAARRATDEQIHAVLGDVLYGTWLGDAGARLAGMEVSRSDGPR
jgi:hypothetical protein